MDSDSECHARVGNLTVKAHAMVGILLVKDRAREGNLKVKAHVRVGILTVKPCQGGDSDS